MKAKLFNAMLKMAARSTRKNLWFSHNSVWASDGICLIRLHDPEQFSGGGFGVAAQEFTCALPKDEVSLALQDYAVLESHQACLPARSHSMSGRAPSMNLVFEAQKELGATTVQELRNLGSNMIQVWHDIPRAVVHPVDESFFKGNCAGFPKKALTVVLGVFDPKTPITLFGNAKVGCLTLQQGPVSSVIMGLRHAK